MINFKEGDRVITDWEKCPIGIVKSVYTEGSDGPWLWILWDGSDIPSTCPASRVKLLPKVPKVGEVYTDRGEFSRYKVIGVVETPKGAAVVYESSLQVSFDPYVFTAETFMRLYHKVD